MDAETFIWWIVPLLATIAGAVYAARKDLGLEERIRRLEMVEAHREGRESNGQDSPDPVDTELLVNMGGQIAANTQAVKTLGEQLDNLEKDE